MAACGRSGHGSGAHGWSGHGGARADRNHSGCVPAEWPWWLRASGAATAAARVDGSATASHVEWAEATRIGGAATAAHAPRRSSHGGGALPHHRAWQGSSDSSPCRSGALPHLHRRIRCGGAPAPPPSVAASLAPDLGPRWRIWVHGDGSGLHVRGSEGRAPAAARARRGQRRKGSTRGPGWTRAWARRFFYFLILLTVAGNWSASVNI